MKDSYDPREEAFKRLERLRNQLAKLMDVVGVLIERYEDEHVAELG